LRSFCPVCHSTLSWYDLIPLASWIALAARCRRCNAKISWLYPFIELLTALTFTALYHTTAWFYFPAYFVLFSALIVTIRSDLEYMLILRAATLGIIPVALIASYFHFLPLSLMQSILGACLGYALLWSTRQAFWLLKQQEGMGEGDLELLAAIGAFTGPYGCWTILIIGSLMGSFIGLILMAYWKIERNFRIPFGPFLAGATLIYLLYKPTITAYMHLL
jgi:leader peptidase (prepilin peptidase) / N-methyltransferase